MHELHVRKATATLEYNKQEWDGLKEMQAALKREVEQLEEECRVALDDARTAEGMQQPGAYCQQDAARQLNNISALLKLAQMIDPVRLQLIMEECCVTGEAYEMLASIVNSAGAAAAGMRPNEAGCPKVFPAADTVQQNKNDFNELFKLLDPHKLARNPGCLLDMYDVVSLVARNTQAQGYMVYIKLHVDGNTHNGKKHLFMSIVNVTDNVKTADNPSPLLSSIQDPNTIRSMDLGCFTTDSDLKDKDLEGIEV
jgi:hypothetical protein